MVLIALFSLFMVYKYLCVCMYVHVQIYHANVFVHMGVRVPV